MANAWDEFKSWVASPFSADMSALEWALFVGFLMVLMILWRYLFVHIRGEFE